MTSPSPSVLSAARLAEYLRIPDAADQLSPVSGTGRVVLDLREDSATLPAADRDRLVATLPTLPCVVVALSDAGRVADCDAALAHACDVSVANEEALTNLLAGFEQTPIAALAFVQLLRGGDVRRGIAAGLAAESFVYSTLQSGAEFKAWRGQRKRHRRSASDDSPACRLSREADRLEIEFTRAEKHNAFSRRMRDDLCEALQLVRADDSIEEVVLSGEGPSFCSGGDLDEFGSFSDPAAAHVIRTTRSPALLLAQVADRVRCRVHGACIGAGIELPAFTRHVVAEEHAFFQLPEVGLGLVPGAGGTVSLPARIGRQRTAWMGLSGERVDAPTALEWGLVDEIRLV